MSGTRPAPMGANVVPFATTTPPPTTPPPPMPPYWWGGPAPLPGCAPSGGGSGLIECYWGVQAATAFISAIMIDAINNNPAVTTAIIDAIVASGSNVPLIGVTNGTAAQAGQVGEYIQLQVTVPYTTAPQTQNVTMGILQPGDWDVWQFASFSTYVTGAQFQLSPDPPGFSHSMYASQESGTGSTIGLELNCAPAQALISVPTLVVFSLTTNANTAGTVAGNCLMGFNARRAR